MPYRRTVVLALAAVFLLAACEPPPQRTVVRPAPQPAPDEVAVGGAVEQVAYIYGCAGGFSWGELEPCQTRTLGQVVRERYPQYRIIAVERQDERGARDVYFVYLAMKEKEREPNE